MQIYIRKNLSVTALADLFRGTAARPRQSAALGPRAVLTAALALGPLVLGAGPSALQAHAQQPGGCQGAGCATGFTPADPPVDLVAAYALCSEAAASRMLSPAEAGTCSAAFLRLKLAFLPDVTLDGFLKMDPAERSEVNRRGYLQYLRWKETVQAQGS